MPSARDLVVAFLCLLAPMLAGFPSCERAEEPAPLERPELPFYLGLEVVPRHSESRVDRPHSRHVLEPALQGDVVKHDFLIENDSEEPLELSRVKGFRGLAVESYSRSVPPGMTGRISALILTDSRGGEEIEGTIQAETNQEARPRITIDVALSVEEFASVSPYRVWLKGSSEDEIVETCVVIPNRNHPFSISGIRARKGVWFSHGYREIEKDGRRGYEITLRNTRRKPGSYQDVLFVQTDSSARPEFKIRIEGRISE